MSNNRQQITDALNLYALAANVFAAVEADRITPAFFGKGTKIETGGRTVTIDNNYTQTALRSHSQNLLFAALGTTAIIVDCALDSAIGPKNPSDTTPTGSARAVIYMLRCAFAHNMALPTWSCKNKYQFLYTIVLPQAGRIAFDAKAINGQNVKLDHIGGLAAYLELILFCKNLVP